MTRQTLEQITKAEADAQEAAQRAQAAAETARIRAEEAKHRAAQERENANRRHLDLLVKAHPRARVDALDAQAERRAALEDAVRTGSDVFGTYRVWVEASVHVWEVDSALAQQRHYHGMPTRETPVPAFNFNNEIGAIIDRMSMEAQDDALQRIQDRRAAFLAGKEL